MSCKVPLRQIWVCACSAPPGTVPLLFSKIIPPAPVCGADLKGLHPHLQCAAVLFTLLVCTAWPGGFGKRGLMPSWDHLGSPGETAAFLPFIPLEVQDWPRCCLLTFILCAAPFDLQNCFGFCWFVPALHSPPTQQGHSCLLKLWEYLDSAPNPQSVHVTMLPVAGLFLGGLTAGITLYWCHKAKAEPGTQGPLGCTGV